MQTPSGKWPNHFYGWYSAALMQTKVLSVLPLEDYIRQTQWALSSLHPRMNSQSLPNQALSRGPRYPQCTHTCRLGWVYLHILSSSLGKETEEVKANRGAFYWRKEIKWYVTERVKNLQSIMRFSSGLPPLLKKYSFTEDALLALYVLKYKVSGIEGTVGINVSFLGY